MKPRVLLVDDDEAVLSVLSIALTRQDHEVATAKDAAAMWNAIAARCPDVVVMDRRLPDADGVELVEEIKLRYSGIQVIILTGHGSLDAAVNAIKAGAFHFAAKPIELDGFCLLVQRAFEHKQLAERAETLHQAVSTLGGETTPLFRSSAMRHLLRVAGRVAASEAPVFIAGESGTGKEVIANVVHSLSGRASKPFIKVSCAALIPDLIESGLSGVVTVAHTEGHAHRDSLFAQAQDGTILFDEISEIPADTQSTLLRVLQTNSARPGDSHERALAKCRIIATTNRQIDRALAEHKIREDLYYRISTVMLHVPPLRQRPEDIVPLANAFLRRFAAQAGADVRAISDAALECLRRFEWPGNVRQLENEIQRAVLVAEGDTVEVKDLSIPYEQSHNGAIPATGLAAMERTAVIGALRQTGGNKAAAARQLGITRQTLYNKLRDYGLEV